MGYILIHPLIFYMMEKTCLFANEADAIGGGRSSWQFWREERRLVPPRPIRAKITPPNCRPAAPTWPWHRTYPIDFSIFSK